MTDEELGESIADSPTNTDRAQVAELGQATSPSAAETADARTLRQVREVLEQSGHLVSTDLAECVQHVVELAQRRGPSAQPAPSGGRGDVWVDVIQHLDEMGVAGLRPRCEARRELGIQRYGVPLGYDDGRDPERDLEDELLDGAAYAWRLGLRRLTRTLLQYADDLEMAEVQIREGDEQLDDDEHRSHQVAEILRIAGVPPGPYVERIRSLVWTEREWRTARALLDCVGDSAVADSLAALMGVSRG